MKKFIVFIISFLTLLFIPLEVNAKTEYDKYYVSITLRNLDDANYTIMLLTIGPGKVEEIGEDNIFKIELPENYYFSNAKQKDSNQYLISDELTIYGAANYWSCNYELGFKFKKSYNYGYAVAMFFFRMFVVIVIEIAIAFVYKFNKKSHWIIFGTNTSLQLLANLYLNIQTYNFGITPISKGIGCLALFFVEALIFVISLITYNQYCSRNNIIIDNGNEKIVETKDSIWKYVLLICVLSFIVGAISLIFWQFGA